MAPEEFIQGQLNDLHKTCAATQQAVVDLTAKFDRIIDYATKLDTRITTVDNRAGAIELKMATADSAHAATASQAAKFWAAIGGAISMIVGIVGGIVGDWFLFGRGH